MILFCRISILFLLTFFCSGCLLYPHRGPEITVEGEIFDNKDGAPLRDVEIEVRINNAWVEVETKTDAAGKFIAKTKSSLKYFLLFFGSDKERELEVELKVNREGYESDVVQDSYHVSRDEESVVDFGPMYMNRKR